MLLQYILGAHSIKHSEFLYLETGATPLKQVITCRRIIYLHTILKRPATELTHKVYKAQQESLVGLGSIARKGLRNAGHGLE